MSVDPKEQKEKAKNVRRAAKGKLTRTISTYSVLLDAQRPIEEIEVVFKEAKAVYTALVTQHEEYTMFLNDEDYNEAEIRLNESTNEYTRMSIVVSDYVKEKGSQGKVQEEENRASIKEVTCNQPITQHASDTVNN